MDFYTILDQIVAVLQQRGRVTYRALQRQFALDDDAIADMKEELLFSFPQITEEAGRGLVWTDNATGLSSQGAARGAPQPPPLQMPNSAPRTFGAPHSQFLAAERRQLTVMFCDLVGSTTLSTQLDPEALRDIIRHYQQTCATVIHRYDGYIAQYLGDGLLVYFGYPTAHEDDARRAVRVGLEIVEALRGQSWEPQSGPPLHVRIGIHSGLVVIDDLGTVGRTEPLALGETPNIAARIQGVAEANTVMISAATHRLVEGQFESQSCGSHMLKGIATPMVLYHVQREHQYTSPLVRKHTLTSLVGREQEVGVLLDRWEQAQEGRGHVVLLSGEPGIGKSRLAYTLTDHVTNAGALFWEARCSPYHQQSAFYPLIESLQHAFLLTREDSEREKVEKMEHALAVYGLHEAVPLFAALLSLPPPHTPALMLTPQKQKERTLHVLVQWMIAQADRHPIVSVWEDVHWVDPSSLAFLSLLIEQIPTTKLLLVLTFRPEFTPPWKPHSHLSQLVLNRLGKRQVEVMITQAAGAHQLSPAVIAQIQMKTDGVPLFVEELTKSVVEAREQSTGNGEHGNNAGDMLAIPTTLQETLLARLDRLSSARPIAQLGATLGREFSQELLQAVAPFSATEVQTALTKLVDAEVLYQRGMGEQAQYSFKHALIQDTAYHSLLKSTRQQYHQRIAQVLTERFPDTAAIQPELLAHHYTEAGLIEQAIPHWQSAGLKAIERSANDEAVSHFTKGLAVLNTFPETGSRAQQELGLQVGLGTALGVLKGYTTTEVEQVYLRARALCQYVGETAQLAPTLFGLWVFHLMRAEYHPAREFGEQLLLIADNTHDAALRVVGHYALSEVFFRVEDLRLALEHMEHGPGCYDMQQHRSLATLYAGYDPAVACLSLAAITLWLLGYPDRALKKAQDAIALANELAQPMSQVFALNCAGWLQVYLRDGQAAHQYATAVIALSRENASSYWGILEGALVHGWALAEQGDVEEGIARIREGAEGYHAVGGALGQPGFLGLLADAYRKAGQIDASAATLAEAFAVMDKTGERVNEAELYRIKGELTLQSHPQREESRMKAAEAHILNARDIARTQHAKSLELRAATSLARLWQQQGRHHEAHQMLSEIYDWFTEGFTTKDLQEAKALLGSPV